MKWNINTPTDRGWHEWYAWYPVRTSVNDRVWLEKVVRRQTGRTKHWVDWLFLDFFSDYEYKESIFQILKDGDEQV